MKFLYKMNQPENTFQLHGQSGGFSDRLNSVFGALDSKPNKSENNEQNESSPERSTSSTCRSPERDNFKKPYNRPHQNRHSRYNRRSARDADHVLNPNNYTKYSLKNDGTRSSKLSGDALNKKIALDFIDNLRQEKQDTDEKDIDINETDFKPRFNQSHKKDRLEGVKKTETSVFQSSHGAKANVMETFEFGKSSETSTKNPEKKKTNLDKKFSDESKSSKSITLNYYEDEEEEE